MPPRVLDHLPLRQKTTPLKMTLGITIAKDMPSRKCGKDAPMSRPMVPQALKLFGSSIQSLN
jgi:hypothetical protein